MGEAGAQFLPGQFGPAELGGGPGSVWRVDGATGEVTLLANVDGGTGSVASLPAPGNFILENCKQLDD